MELFSPEFYTWMRAGSLRSAREIMPILRRFVQPDRVVDVACGTGEWLQVFRENGARTLLGVDAPWVRKNRLAIEDESFLEADISRSLVIPGDYDLALMLEAVQHVPAERAQDIVRTLTGLAPVVLFSAPIPLQGGSGDDAHEQWPEFWAELFEDCGFVCVDAIRREIWMNERVEWWYAQNMILFVRRDQLECNDALRAAYEATPGPPLPLIHPRLYESRSAPNVLEQRAAVERIARGAYNRLRTALGYYWSMLACICATPIGAWIKAATFWPDELAPFEFALLLL